MFVIQEFETTFLFHKRKLRFSIYSIKDFTIHFLLNSNNSISSKEKKKKKKKDISKIFL